MKLKIITICLLLFSLIGYCQIYEGVNLKFEKAYGKNDSNGKKTGLWSFYRKDNSLSAKIHFLNGIREGITKMYWENGNLYNSVNYVKGKKEGGDKTYFKNGSIAKVISFKSGLKNGEKKEYRSDGSVNSIKNYKNDVLHGSFVKFYGGEIYISGNYENGKKHGNWLKYYEGEVSLESAYKLGVPNGIWKAHFLASGARKDSLNLRDQVEYEYEVYNGVVINPIKIYEYTNIYSYYGKVQKQYWQGNIDVKTAEPAKARYFNKTGVWKKYNMQGKILGQLENKNGVEISKTTYFSNGNKSEEFEIKDGIYYYTYYWENGNLRNKGTSLNNISGEYIKFEAYWTDGEKLQEQYQNKNIKFKNGKKHEVFEQSKWGVDHGKYIKYYQNTEVEIRGFYENDKKSGLWKYYNEKGKLIKTENYSNGIKQ